MKALIPMDGRWHKLPERPVISIHAPLAAHVDIDHQGVGLVWLPRDPEGKSLEVKYTVGERAES